MHAFYILHGVCVIPNDGVIAMDGNFTSSFDQTDFYETELDDCNDSNYSQPFTAGCQNVPLSHCLLCVPERV